MVIHCINPDDGAGGDGTLVFNKILTQLIMQKILVP
jgi:hypothetical protein